MLLLFAASREFATEAATDACYIEAAATSRPASRVVERRRPSTAAFAVAVPLDKHG
jgi:hypothetical protein